MCKIEVKVQKRFTTKSLMLQEFQAQVVVFQYFILFFQAFMWNVYFRSIIAPRHFCQLSNLSIVCVPNVKILFQSRSAVQPLMMLRR